MPNWIPNQGLKVAIDGPSGSGKGTAASLLASEIGLPVLDTGLLYRYIGTCMEQRVNDITEEASVLERLDDCLSEMDWRGGGIIVRGEDWTDRLRDEKTAAAASRVARMPGVRQRLLNVQRSLAEHGCVMEGRDIGTTVLPHADIKFFLTASLRERTRRRWAQLQELGAEASLDGILYEIKERDVQDIKRPVSPLRQAEDAVRIDSTTMRIDEVTDRMLAIMERRELIRCAVNTPEA